MGLSVCCLPARINDGMYFGDVQLIPMAVICGFPSNSLKQSAKDWPSEICISSRAEKLIHAVMFGNSLSNFAIACASRREGMVSQASMTCPELVEGSAPASINALMRG